MLHGFYIGLSWGMQRPPGRTKMVSIVKVRLKMSTEAKKLSEITTK